MASPSAFGRRGVAVASAAPTYGATPRRRPSSSPSSAAASSAGSPLSGAAEAFAPFLRLYFSFNGRIRRRDYWLAYVSATVAMLLGLWFELSMQALAKGNLAGLLLLLPFSLALPVVGTWSLLAVQVKRWHDRDKSWPWLFIGFIPFVGGLWLFVELGCLEGTRGDNRFGHSPKLGPAAVFD
jgi:uncharacterized membrane protein YhaH (DUF805 family)